jgi:WD40 repeat protein
MYESVADGHRFLLAFYDMIQTSVAQIYHFALPFAPKTPLWDAYYERELRADARVLQGRETYWTSLVRTVPLSDCAQTVTYSHNGHLLAVGGTHSSQLFWSATGERLAELGSGQDSIDSVSFSCNDQTLATATWDTVHLWDIASGSRIAELCVKGICSVEFHPSIEWLLVAGDRHGLVCVWNVRDGSRTDLNVVGNTTRPCWARQHEPKRVLVGCEGGRVEMWDVDARQQVQVFMSSQSDGRVEAVASSNDGSLVASGSSRGMLAVYSTHTSEVLHSHEHWDDILSVAFSPTAPILAFASEFDVYLWFYATDRIVTFSGHLDDVKSVAFSPNGRFIASASRDSTLRTWETDATDPPPDDIDYSEEIRPVHFSNDGQLVVSVSFDETVKVWDTRTGTLCTTLKGHTGGVQHTIILPDNVHIVSIDYSGTLKVWDWRKGEILFTDDISITCEDGKISYLFPYTHAVSPLGFISAHYKCFDEYAVCCWTIDLSVPGSTRVVLVARGVVALFCTEILQITHRGTTEGAHPTLILECRSGKQFSALWNDPNVVDGSPAQLHFVEELKESPLKGISNRLPLVGSELPCRWSDDKAWVLDDHGWQILWVPASNRGDGRWCGRRLATVGRNGRFTLVNFSDVILDDKTEF